MYLVQQDNRQFYLTISCKERNMLSVSMSGDKNFEEHPRFNIYGNVEDIPRMGKKSYTFLK